MTVEYRTGDLFQQDDVNAIGHGVNCCGVMGGGIAKIFRAKYPQMFLVYRELCKEKQLKLGGVQLWQEPDGFHIFNLASQYKPGADARLHAVEESLKEALRLMQTHGIESLALPQIGCGIGGLKWLDVSAVAEKIFTEEKERLVLVSL